MSNRRRLFILLPVSLLTGMLISEAARELPTPERGLDRDRQSGLRENKTEWLVGRSAAMAASHSPLVEATN